LSLTHLFCAGLCWVAAGEPPIALGSGNSIINANFGVVSLGFGSIALFFSGSCNSFSFLSFIYFIAFIYNFISLTSTLILQSSPQFLIKSAYLFQIPSQNPNFI
jgi:hypothetical protein